MAFQDCLEKIKLESEIQEDVTTWLYLNAKQKAGIIKEVKGFKELELYVVNLNEVSKQLDKDPKVVIDEAAYSDFTKRIKDAISSGEASAKNLAKGAGAAISSGAHKVAGAGKALADKATGAVETAQKAVKKGASSLGEKLSDASGQAREAAGKVGTEISKQAHEHGGGAAAAATAAGLGAFLLTKALRKKKAQAAKA
jgi:hypothetical protein